MAYKKPSHLCATPFCRNTKRRGRAGHNYHYCHKCNKRRWREKHQVHDAFLNLKHHAKQRNIAFKLTLEQFTDFCAKTGYDKIKGRAATSLQIDRIKSDGPYSIDNIQPLTCSENSSKGARDIGAEPLTYNPFLEDEPDEPF